MANIPYKEQGSSTIGQCTCNARDKLACDTCMSIANMGKEYNQIIIKPGDIVKYNEFNTIYNMESELLTV